MQNEQIKQIVTGAFFKDEDICTDLQTAFRIKGKTIASPGNFVTISGAAKSRKTTFAFGAISSFFLKAPVYDMQLLGDTSDLLVHIDTESSVYSFSKQCNYLKKKLKINKLPETFLPFLFREYQPQQILKSIAFIVEAKKPKFLVLDNLTDMVLNINDPEETSKLIGFLKKLTKDYNLTLIALLHTGKNNGLTLGWLGSYSDRAAQSTLIVTKDKETKNSVLESVFMRDDESFYPVAITWSEELRDYEVLNGYTPPEPMKKGKFSIANFNDQDLKNAVEIIFNNEEQLKYEPLVTMVKNTFCIGTNIAKQTIIPNLISKKLIVNKDGNYKQNN
jgi:hypothetical protein